MEPALIYVATAYGDKIRIDANQLYLSMRNQLSIYTKSGQRLCDYYEQMNWRHKSTTLHRANIAEIIG